MYKYLGVSISQYLIERNSKKQTSGGRLESAAESDSWLIVLGLQIGRLRSSS